jgi:hypothetical protein
MPGVNEVLSEKPAAASNLEHEAVTRSDVGQEPQNPGSAGVGVESEPEVVDAREIRLVVRLIHHVRQSAINCGEMSSVRPCHWPSWTA